MSKLCKSLSSDTSIKLIFFFVINECDLHAVGGVAYSSRGHLYIAGGPRTIN